jgi:hypothetical protein
MEDKTLHAYLEKMSESYGPERGPNIQQVSTTDGRNYWLLPLEAIRSNDGQVELGDTLITEEEEEGDVEAEAEDENTREDENEPPIPYLRSDDSDGKAKHAVTLRVTPMNRYSNNWLEEGVRGQALVIVCFDISQPWTLKAAKTKVSLSLHPTLFGTNMDFCRIVDSADEKTLVFSTCSYISAWCWDTAP